MLINIIPKNMSLTPAIEDYARKKVEKLPRYFDRIQSVDVIIEKRNTGYAVEILTDVEHHEDFVATSSHDDLYACIDLTVDRSIRQLTDHKSRIRNHHVLPHHAGPHGTGQNGQVPSPEASTRPSDVPSKGASSKGVTKGDSSKGGGRPRP